MRLSKDERYKRIHKLIGKAERYWRPRHEAMREKMRFLIDGLHYSDSEYERLEKDSSLIRWIGQESFHVWRHEVAFTTDSPTSISAVPLDANGDDPAVQEEATSLVQAEWNLPGKEYEELCEDMVGSASGCGIGAFTYDIIGEGRWGEVVPRDIRYDQLMWDPSAKSPLSRRCKWVILKVRMVRSDALMKCSGSRARWSASVVNKLKSDEGYAPEYFDGTQSTPQARTDQTEDMEWSEEDEITFYLVYERTPPDTKTQDSEEDDGFEPLPDPLRYMACQCGYRSNRQSTLEDGKEYPESMVCPECGQVATRIDGVQKVDRVLEYPDGRLTVMAPYGGVDRFVYEGDWEVASRNYPIVFLSRFRHPTRPYGPSLADLNWYNQVAVDTVMRIALERLAVSASYWVMPAEGIEDAWGQPWQFSDENGFAMYYKGTSMPAIDLKEGTGIPQAWSAVYNLARAALIDKTGIADFGLSPGQSRDIPASSVAQQIQQQEIPTAHYKRHYQRAKGYAYDLLYDYLQAIYPDERPARIKGSDGRERVVATRPSALPRFQFFVSDAPDFKALEEGKKAAFETVLNLIERAPWALEIAEMAFHLPHSIIQKGKDDFQKWKDQMAPPPVPGAPPGPPGLPGAPRMGGVPGAGGLPQPQGGDQPSAMMGQLMQTLGSLQRRP